MSRLGVASVGVVSAAAAGLGIAGCGTTKTVTVVHTEVATVVKTTTITDTVTNANTVTNTARRTPQRRPTSTNVNVDQETSLSGTQTYAVLSVSVDAGATQVRGLPITFTVSDGTTGRRLATFSGTSNLLKFCTIVYSLNGADTMTFSGRAVAPYAACSLGSVSVPAADAAVITAKFAGNAKLAPSADTNGL